MYTPRQVVHKLVQRYGVAGALVRAEQHMLANPFVPQWQQVVQLLRNMLK